MMGSTISNVSLLSNAEFDTISHTMLKVFSIPDSTCGLLSYLWYRGWKDESEHRGYLIKNKYNQSDTYGESTPPQYHPSAPPPWVLFVLKRWVRDKSQILVLHHAYVLLESQDKEVKFMWIIVGYVLCAVARNTGFWKLYTASRHSFRSDRPGLFMQYWHSAYVWS